MNISENRKRFYIGGQWVPPTGSASIDVINPSTGSPLTAIASGTEHDVEKAVLAAESAFTGFANSSKHHRIELLEALIAACRSRAEEFAEMLTLEVGIPITYARDVQVSSALAHLEHAIATLKTYPFDKSRASTRIRREPIGVVGMITPWNWPLVQIICKVAPALSAGCTMVLKPSELAPITAIMFAEAVHEAGIPAGVFNLVNGHGQPVGEAIARHPRIQMVSFTGSTRAGIAVAKLAADNVKRVTQELGGKSPNIILADADLKSAVELGVMACFDNNGQTCDAPTRMLVPAGRIEEVEKIARATAEAYIIGEPSAPATKLGPLISQNQFDKVQALISKGIDEGARLVAGGLGRPENFDRGYYVRPTVFSGVTSSMTIFKEEIFGPVLSIIPYTDEREAIRLANDSNFGLAAFVQSADRERAQRVADEVRAGTVYINYPDYDLDAPFGGYKESGNGREFGTHGLEEYLETKSIISN
ncbi:MAG: aldehyde dehydrogenase family protein [Hyphomicrobium sp.]|uniref:aldehyde dehydrogenase family protein n=1 Tax=Hyphomicrobium sp. TaxID=82 RepID=UPI0039E29A7D